MVIANTCFDVFSCSACSGDVKVLRCEKPFPWLSLIEPTSPSDVYDVADRVRSGEGTSNRCKDVPSSESAGGCWQAAGGDTSVVLPHPTAPRGMRCRQLKQMTLLLQAQRFACTKWGRALCSGLAVRRRSCKRLKTRRRRPCRHRWPNE